MVSHHLIAPVVVLCFVQGIGNSFATHILPFIAAYFLSLGVEPSEVSTYSGIAESLLSLVEAAALPLHIWAIKRLPHRISLVASLLATRCLSGSFGFCTKPWQILVLRAATGGLNVVGFAGTMIMGEIVDEQSKAQAFSWSSAGNLFGAMSGAAISGYLAQPASRVPFFGHILLFQDKPYIWPGLLLLALAILASVAVMIWVPETNAQHSLSDVPHVAKATITYKTLLKTPAFNSILAVNMVVKVCFFGSLTLMSTAGKLPPSMGGLGLSVAQIGLVFFLTQMVTAVNLVVIFKAIADRFSLRRITLFSTGGWLMVAIFFPIANALSLSHVTPIPTYTIWFVGSAVGMMWWPCSQLLALACYPDLGNRTKAAGLLRQSSNLANAFGSASYGHIFGISSGYDPHSLGRIYIWLWIVGLALLTIAVASRQSRLETGGEHSQSVDEGTALLSRESGEGSPP